MKRSVLFLLVFAMLFGACACGAAETPVSTTVPDSPETTVPSSETAASDVTEEPSSAGTEAPVAAVPESIKILAIGNSFSTDCMEYLYVMLRQAGVKKIVLGNLYYGGCTMAQHLNFALTDSASYTYYKNTAGSWNSNASYKMSQAIADEDWDIISMQESSKTAGIDSAYKASFAKLVAQVRKQNSTATLIWNMTWAYQQDSTHSAFPNYDKDQMKMYTMITECVQKYVTKDAGFAYVIPMATVIQNARTSFLGDTLTRDGYHLNKGFSRWMAALCWTCTITGVSPETITYNPAPTQITDDMKQVAYESIKNAFDTPYAVTQSKITSGNGSLTTDAAETLSPTEVLNPEDCFEEDRAVALANGVNLDNYTLLKWDYLENQYWVCNSIAGTKTPGSTASTYQQNVCSKKKYSLDEIPVGSVFISDTGWQFRLEIFENLTTKFSGERPGMCTANYFILTSEFMGTAKYLAWNVSSNPKTNISAIYAQAAAHVRVYVPNK